ncbi:MAG: FG-GAP repeat protein [Planctomycetota bacterium]|jgi:hypothetical protein
MYVSHVPPKLFGLISAIILLPATHPAQAQVCQLFERQKLTAPDAAPHDRFGSDVATDGARVIVGAWHDNDRTGSAYLYRRDDNGTPLDSWDDTWVLEGKLTASGGTGREAFGSSVSIHADRALVGAPEHDGAASSTGSAYVFRRVGSWVEETMLTASDAAPYDYFGYSVSISGDTAIAGAPGYDGAGPYSGAVYVFRLHDNGTPLDPGDDFWTEEAQLTASNADAEDRFGGAAFIDGDRLIVGARRAKNGAGAAYVFRRGDNGTPLVPSDDFWIEEAELAASDADAAGFGSSVSIAGDRIAVGAPWGGCTGSVYRRLRGH